jgi:hypothetical protein
VASQTGALACAIMPAEQRLHRRSGGVPLIAWIPSSFGDLEPVADLEAADRAPLDPLDCHALVVQPHLGHLGVE